MSRLTIMIKLTTAKIETARTKNGSYTSAQVKHMQNLFGKKWKSNAIKDGFMLESDFDTFKQLNTTVRELQREKYKNAKGGKEKLDTGRCHIISKAIENKPSLNKYHQFVEKLSQSSNRSCIRIYNDFTELEIKGMKSCIKGAWRAGKRMVEHLAEIESKKIINEG